MLPLPGARRTGVADQRATGITTNTKPGLSMSAEPPQVALVFINWNSGELAQAAVRSARETAAAPAALRVIIVDNGSSDDSVEMLRRELPEAELVLLPENQGFARAVNAGLACVREPYALILNTDILFRNDAITLLVTALAEDDRATLACPKLLRADGSTQAAAVPEPRLFWELTNRSLARHLLRVREAQTSAVPGIVGSCMAVDMTRIRQIGLLDERFFFFFEETDWCKRINDSGGRVLYVPAAEVTHLQGQQANRRPIRARIQFYCSRYRYFRKHGGISAVTLLYLGLLLRLSVNVLLYGLLAVLSLGRPRSRDRLCVYAALWWWHCLLCRPKWGFEP